MRSREAIPLFGAYSAAWSRRPAPTGETGETVDVLYVEMHRADLDAFLKISNPILDFATEHWNAGSPPVRFEREFSRHRWSLIGRSLTGAAAANVRAVRAVLENLR